MIDPRFQKLYDMAREEVTGNILPWWMTYAVDNENGGFYGEVDNNNKPVEKADKFITLNARLIWTFSSAYRIFGDETYKEMADRAYGYFIRYFWDEETEGFHKNLDYQGGVLDDTKYIYGNAFAIYDLSEYARAIGSKEALLYAQRLQRRLELKPRDHTYKGYYEGTDREWNYSPWIMGVNRYPTDVKTMNTHLHLLEAYTCLFRVDQSPKLRAKLREHLYLMLNKIVDKDIHHFYYYQDRQWNPTSADISFGHDIEGSWLMLEAAEVLGEKEALEYAKRVCANMARACLEEGFTDEGAMAGEYHPETDHLDVSRFGWWEQNETTVGFLNAWELTGEDRFLDAALKSYEFQDRYFVDHEKGGWFAVVDGKTKKPVYPRKVSGPVCPYHNGRMCFEIIERYRRLAKGE